MDNHPKPNWSDAPPDAQAGIGASEGYFAAWYKRKGTAVYQICPAGGIHEWTWMGGRTDFPYGHEIRPASKKVEIKPAEIKSVAGPDLLLAALKDCVLLMERDLNGLALIQPELKQAKQAIDQFEIVDATFVDWNGEGLPPVGITVEAHIDHSWVSAEVLAHGVDGEDEVAVLQVGSRIKTKTFTGIRPIRTPEQIAAEDREKQIRDMADIYSSNRSTDFYNALWDAGYRKQVTP